MEKAFKGHECVVATHVDAEHIHSHIVFNSVNADSGMKYHSNKFTLNDIRSISDEICQKYGVQTLEKPVVNQRTDGITTGDIRSRQQLESSDSSAYVTHQSGGTGQRESKSDYDSGADELSLGKSTGNIQSGEIGVQTHSANHSRADNELLDELNQPIGKAVITGWEAERGILLAAERIRRLEAQNAIENAQVGCDFTISAVDVIAGIADVAAIMDGPEEDEDIEWHSDSKVLTEEIRRKEALGMHMG